MVVRNGVKLMHGKAGSGVIHRSLLWDAVMPLLFSSEPRLITLPQLVLFTNLTKILSLVTTICAGILELSMGARNRVEIGLSYRPARL